MFATFFGREKGWLIFALFFGLFPFKTWELDSKSHFYSQLDSTRNSQYSTWLGSDSQFVNCDSSRLAKFQLEATSSWFPSFITCYFFSGWNSKIIFCPFICLLTVRDRTFYSFSFQIPISIPQIRLSKDFVAIYCRHPSKTLKNFTHTKITLGC